MIDKEIENTISEITGSKNIKCQNLNVENLNFLGDSQRDYYLEFLDVASNIRAKCYTL